MFIKVQAYVVKKAEFSAEWNSGFTTAKKTMKFICGNTIEDIVVNSDDISFFKKTEMNSINEEKCSIIDGDLRSLEPSENDAFGEDMMTIKVDDKIHSNITDDRGFIKKVQVGLLVLRSGIHTNLGINGMDVDQCIYVTLDSFEKLDWRFSNDLGKYPDSSFGVME